MKHRFKNRVLSLVLSVCMMMPIMTQAMPVYSVDEEVETLGAFTTPFTEQTPITLPDNTTTTSKSYRIPSMVTLNDGTIVAAADIRWNTTYDGGGLDTLVARSIDGGASWDYTLANYLGDNGNEYNAQSTTFIDSSLLVGADGQTVYMLVDLYAGGVALNGNGSQKLPSTDIGFDDDGHLLLSSNSRASYDFYLNGTEIIEISTQTAVDGVTVDEYFNVTYTENGEVKYTSNLFFADSPYKVAQTGYLYLIKSTDGGKNWSAPTLLNLKQSGEQVCLVGPGHGITTSKRIMVFPVYGYDGNAESQRMGFVYSDDGGATWKRSDDFTYTSNESVFSSEATVVELNNGTGTLRFFYRNDSKELKYADCSYDSLSEEWVWSAEQSAGVSINSDTQLSAITYSKTIDGKQVILVSCPTGPNCEGSNDNNGSERINGKVFVFVVENSGSMTLMNSINLFDTASDRLPKVDGQDIFDENTTFFAYSTLTERADGSVALLYENSQYGWGAANDTYFTITGKAFSKFDLIGGLEIEEGVREKVLVDADVTEVMLYNVTETGEVVSYGTTIPASELDDVYYITDSYYDTTTHTLLYKVECCVGAAWPEGYEEYRFVPAAVLDKTDSGIAYPIVNFTNAASFRKFTTMEPRAAYNLRTRLAAAPITGATGLATNGLALSKTVNDNGDGTYTVTLEAFTTGTVTTQESTKPMDIVLVIDQSGSMSQCIECGQNMLNKGGSYSHDVSYTRVYNSTNNPLDKTKRYYIQYGQNYTEVEYRNGSWRRVNSTSNGSDNSYTPNTPNTSWWDDHTQFYEKSREAGACTRRYDALVSALNGFVTEVRAKAIADPNNPVPHRIAIVGFSSDGYHNSEILTGVTVDPNGPTDIDDNYIKYYPNSTGYNGVQYGSNITTAQYQSALQNVSTDAGYTNVTTAIGYLTAHGGTQTLQGMEMALNILQNKTESTIDRDEVVILFTDGATDTKPRSGLITNAHNIKNRDATIYTIGIFEDADGSVPDTAPDKLNDNNDLMHLISSNYPDARMNDYSLSTGNKNTDLKGDDSFYLSAGDAEALNDIFVSISSTMGSVQSELTSSATVRDIVMPQFDVPENTTNVKVYQLAYTPFDSIEQSTWWGDPEELTSTDGVTVTIDTEDNTVDVTGFDFKYNFVAENGREIGTGTSDDNPIKEGDFYGRKLRIVFTVSVDPEFLGGSNVDTNGQDSGVYNGEGVIQGRFERPKVNVPLKPISKVNQEKHIYLTNSTEMTNLLVPYVSVNGKQMSQVANGINNAYVDLVYTVKQDGTTIATFSVDRGKTWNQGKWDITADYNYTYKPDDDTIFTIECVMSDATNPSFLDPSYRSAEGTATIYVYKPVLTFKDSVVNYGAEVSLPSHLVSEDWRNASQGSAKGKPMESVKPELEISYNYDNSTIVGGKVAVTDDIPVTVTVNIPAAFEHVICGYQNCGFDPNTEQFIVHVKLPSTSLTITKRFPDDADYAIDVNQSFLFHVNGTAIDGTPLDLMVAINGTGSVTVTDVPWGEYTVTEIDNWSWRYTPDNTSVTLNLVNSTDKYEAVFVNTRDQIYWLDGDSYCRNYWGNLTPTPATQNTVQ